ncbi:UDP-N-acetylmuramate dehydrogenase [Mesonia sp. K7]|uniref:UDP-N-acetylmuramate dehydrogenase n=1 Tax=Mesonia sp. K7 TaxID=2218606 RepID=UPI000DA8FEDD|nr:UDP-N-acetylmuramate dehydrogenase [Mesonia sp. K7]PZD76786.1 UDP-N-acetylenolpyruvoylglucosamine reductase [Mesonia sp. K7]
MDIQKDFSLKNHNTFGIDVKANAFVTIQSVSELEKALQQVYASEIFVLGGGSNILLTDDVPKTVFYINLLGKKIESEDDGFVYVRANAGENWHRFVLWCINQDFGGIENLSLIPGNVGTSPIQNIGAYGVELKDVFVSCEAIHMQSLEHKSFTHQDCQFGYRDSIFKNEAKGKYIITSVLLKLSKKNHRIKTSYGAIQQELEAKNIQQPTVKDVSDAVIAIRTAKLPNPKELGNSGSFFKNPIVDKNHFVELQKTYENIPSYPISEEFVKVPAGWLIDTLGYKGYRNGDAGVHKNQALVLVNYGNASGKEVYQLAQEIQQKVKDTFGITLEMEVNIIP